MDAVLFVATSEEATRVRSFHDLEDDPCTEPLRVASPGAFVALAAALNVPANGVLEQLRDATCQSFPVWSLSREIVEALAQLSEEELDGVAALWLAKAGIDELDVDLYELTTCLTDMGVAMRACASSDAQLFVLFEEKAIG